MHISYPNIAYFIRRSLRFHSIYVKNPRTCKHLRQSKTCAATLRSLQNLHRLWQLNFQYWFCPSHKAATICIATSALYGVVKLSGPRSIVMGFVAALCLLYLSTLFYKFGKFNDVIQKTLENWKNSTKTSKYMKKFIKSVPVLSINVGNFYHVKKTTVIMVLYTVLNNTITLFLL